MSPSSKSWPQKLRVDFPPPLCFHQHIRMQPIMTIPATIRRIIPVMIIIPSS
jgi:hypothetical protein